MTTSSKQADPRKHVIHVGQKFGYLTIRQRLRDNTKTKSPNLKVQYRCECACGKFLTVPLYYFTRKQPAPKTHCGCKTSTLYSRNPWEYRVWMMMHVRCENPKHIHFRHYGGRGIYIHDDWHKKHGMEGFRRFLEHVGKRPSLKYSIDRIDNDGSYVPGNVRWATSSEQRANQRPRGSTPS